MYSGITPPTIVFAAPYARPSSRRRRWARDLDRRADRVCAAVEWRGRTKGSLMTRTPPPRGASLEELRAEAEHAAQRLALYRRKVLLGQGEPRRLAELERI